ncbi:DUF1858 domain-containing protein [Peloplasma aerotolerans]|uniref:DUF1858 domain-containing protein n=1 Tax=Peloplasma aerotolerans TaxID=3044389 RepID=A0AAW6U6Z5_9MOLU|nr:DUF1858 domain-containing protein [Mariniplasma sp. M4Ah]MDI6453727.1 DUF1858 domain-containing protein [Mariniplasma sp. M4Ah]MDR4968428.1 DUF1858 domain-containing protein [Acholeplasmataceae bacterium]
MIININETILKLINKDEKLRDILYDLGFKEITKPGMLQTVGRFMTLKAGSNLRKIDLKMIVKRLEEEGYQVKGEKNE